VRTPDLTRRQLHRIDAEAVEKRRRRVVEVLDDEIGLGGQHRAGDRIHTGVLVMGGSVAHPSDAR